MGLPSYVCWLVNPMNTIVISCYFHQKPYSFATFFRQLNAIDWGPILWDIQWLCGSMNTKDHKGSTIYIYICTLYTYIIFKDYSMDEVFTVVWMVLKKNDHSIRRSINGSLKSQESIVNTSQTFKKNIYNGYGWVSCQCSQATIR